MKPKMTALPMSLLIVVLMAAGCQPAAQAPVEVTRVVPMEVTRVVEATPAAAPEATAAPAAQAARELVVLAGAGQDTHLINTFLPSKLTIRAGDTVTWKINGKEPHTATFLSGAEPPTDPIPMTGGGPTDLMLNPQISFSTRAPGAPVETYSGTGYFNSGMLSDGTVVAPNPSYSVSFDTPGTYRYGCLLHPGMVGEITVEPNTSIDIPSQADIDAQAKAELVPLQAELDALVAGAAAPVHSEPGPNGTTIWYVPAGREGQDPRIALYDFLPKDLAIKEGDTVVWTSTSFHALSFSPGQEPPAFVLPHPQEKGPPILQVNPQVAFPAKPSGEFDGTGYYSSGLFGVGPLPGGLNFGMTFTKAGSYDYVCPIHKELGMSGNITVTKR